MSILTVIFLSRVYYGYAVATNSAEVANEVCKQNGEAIIAAFNGAIPYGDKKAVYVCSPKREPRP